MTYLQFLDTRARVIQGLWRRLRMPQVGHRFYFTPITPATPMTDTEVKMFGAGGCITRYGRSG